AELDAWLDAVPEVEPASDLVARIASLPALHPRPERAGWWPVGHALAPLLAWGAAAVLGVALGVLATPGRDLARALHCGDGVAEWAGEDEAFEDGLDGSEGWAELSGLALGAVWVVEDE